MFSRPLIFGLSFLLLFNIGTGFASKPVEAKPSKLLSASAGLISALSAGIATYVTTEQVVPTLFIGATSGIVTAGFQHESNRYSGWIGKPYRWDKSKSGWPSSFIKRGYVGLLVTGGIAIVAAAPVIGVNAPPLYTFEGIKSTVQNTLVMTVLCTPVNMVLSRLANEKVENPGPIRKRIVEISSFIVNGVQSAGTAAGIVGNEPLNIGLNGILAGVGGAAWKWKWGLSKKNCESPLKKVSQ